jgi:arylformamidase
MLRTTSIAVLTGFLSIATTLTMFTVAPGARPGSAPVKAVAKTQATIDATTLAKPRATNQATTQASNQAATQATTQATTKPDLTPVILPGSRVERDVSYVANAADKQKLDVYAPAAARDAAVLVFVHGGEWAKGDKTEIRFKPRFFNENGVIFVAVNYRLSGTDKHPAQVNDVASAIKWVRENIATYGGNPDKIVLMGHSAGCHIVSMVGLDPRPLATVDLTPAQLTAVVAWSGGAYDLVDKVRQGGMYAGYINTNFGPDEAAWRDASPVNHVGDAKPMPHFLYASAEAGNATSKVAAESLAAKIRSAGGQAETLLLAGKDHSGANNDIGADGDTIGPQLLAFIRAVTAAPVSAR